VLGVVGSQNDLGGPKIWQLPGTASEPQRRPQRRIMAMKKILLQFDVDTQPCPFDAIVAVDAGADVLLRQAGVTPETVAPLVHGAMFTRGGADLAATAIFLGGSNVSAVEAVAAKVQKTFFGPVRVSVLVDPAGANTTAAAAIVAAARHLPLGDRQAAASLRAVVLGGTGPVGQRVGRLLAGKGVQVTLVSRSRDRAAACCEIVRENQADASLTPAATAELEQLLPAADLIVAAGAAGVELLSAEQLGWAGGCRVCIDLNAVPPAGIAGIAATDKARDVDGLTVYGPLGVGGTKMKIHRAAIARLFTANDQWLDAEELLTIGEQLDASA